MRYHLPPGPRDFASSARFDTARMGVSFRLTRASDCDSNCSGRSVSVKVDTLYCPGSFAWDSCVEPFLSRIRVEWSSPLTTVADSAVVTLGEAGLLRFARNIRRQLAEPDAGFTS